MRRAGSLHTAGKGALRCGEISYDHKYIYVANFGSY